MSKSMRIVVMLSIYNEQDIIEEVVSNLLANDLDVLALDNASTDDSYRICKKFCKDPRFTLDSWSPDGLDLEALTIRLYRAAVSLAPDWLLFCDGDEVMETEMPGRTLRQVIEESERAGCNIIQYNRYDFFMTDRDDMTVTSPTRRLLHYSWQGDFSYRAFKFIPGLYATPSFAHYPIFPPECPYRIAPEMLVLRHYPYRSRAHAELKISTILRKTAADAGGPMFWHARYQRIANESLYREAFDHKLLNRYDPGGTWSRDKKFAPFTDKQPTRYDLFDTDGFLRWRPAPKFHWGEVV